MTNLLELFNKMKAKEVNGGNQQLNQIERSTAQEQSQVNMAVSSESN